MTDTLRFVVPGDPVPKGRAEFFPVKVRKGGKVTTIVKPVTPEATRAYEKRVGLICQIAVNRSRWMTSPKDRFVMTVRVYRKHEGAGGDLDNYVKAVSDAINGVAFSDDRYVRELHASLSQDAERPRVEVEIERVRIGEQRRSA